MSEKFTHAVPIDHGLPAGSIWPWKFTEAFIEGVKVDKYTCAAQYDQEPISAGGSLFKSSMVERRDRDNWPMMKYRVLIVDTAMTKKTSSDHSAAGVYGEGRDGRLYCHHMWRDKLDVPDMEIAVEGLWDRFKAVSHPSDGALRAMYVENKTSGVGLIMRMQRKRIPVVKIERSKDKIARAFDALPWLTASPMIVPTGAPWVDDFEMEMTKFSSVGDSAEDDQVDTLMDAVDLVLAKGRSMMDVL